MKGVPGIAAVIDDVVEGFEDLFDSQFCRMNCQIFSCGLSSGARGGSGMSERLAGTLRSLAPAAPAGLVEDKDGVGTSADPCGDLVEMKMKLHGFGVAERQNEGSTGSVFGADRTEQIGRLGALIMRGSGTLALPGPTIGKLVLLADPQVVLEPDLYRCARRELGADFRHAVGKVFLNASTASGSCL